MKIQNLPIKLTAEILCFLYECNIRGKHCLEKDVFNFFKRTPNYISKGLKFLYEKNIVENKSGNLNITKKYLKDLNGSIQKSKQLIKEDNNRLSTFCRIYIFHWQRKRCSRKR